MKKASISVMLGAIIMAGTLATILLSGKATINFNHNPRMDKLFEYKYYRYDYENGYLNIYLTDAVRKRDGYLSLIQLINKNKDKEVNLYLAGNGGRVNSTMGLWVVLKNHPKKVTTIIYGNVYSAHALLAFSGDDIKILNPALVFMFHIEAVNGKMAEDYCKEQEGKDRNIDIKKKCQDMADKLRVTYDSTIMSPIYTILTKKEREMFYKGHDILLFGADIQERLK